MWGWRGIGDCHRWSDWRWSRNPAEKLIRRSHRRLGMWRTPLAFCSKVRVTEVNNPSQDQHSYATGHHSSDNGLHNAVVCLGCCRWSRHRDWRRIVERVRRNLSRNLWLRIDRRPGRMHGWRRRILQCIFWKSHKKFYEMKPVNNFQYFCASASLTLFIFKVIGLGPRVRQTNSLSVKDTMS